jgi:hypothetical protein
VKRSQIRAKPPDNHLTREQWAAIDLQLLLRSGGMCEARTPDCRAAPDGRVTDRRDNLIVAWSRHHRLPQGMGGTADPEAHRLDRVILACGDGVAGCHGYIERRTPDVYRRGLLIRHGTDPATVPLELASGRLVYLDPGGGFYIAAGWRLASPGDAELLAQEST